MSSVGGLVMKPICIMITNRLLKAATDLNSTCKLVMKIHVAKPSYKCMQHRLRSNAYHLPCGLASPGSTSISSSPDPTSVSSSLLKKRDANHWEKGDHSGARFDLCTVYGHIHQQLLSPSIIQYHLCRLYNIQNQIPQYLVKHNSHLNNGNYM